MSVSGKRAPFLLLGLVLLVAIVSAAFPVRQASANQITARSLTLQAGATDGGSKPSGVVNHFFQFTVPNTGAPSVGSILFQYCTTATGTTSFTGSCTVPNGLSTTGAGVTLDQTGSAATGFTLVKTTNGAPYITRTAASIPANSILKYKLLGVTNPDGTSCGASAPANNNCSFFVRISTYASADTTGTPIDTGTVTASTSTQIVLTGIMPESIIFCTGGTISTTAGIPDCTTATSGSINFNQLFSPTDTAWATSQMAASTNAGSGYVITVNGPTLTSGSNTIPAIGATAAASTKGVGQFGMNLMADATPTITGSADVTPAPNGTNFMGKPSTNFNTADSYAFNPAAANTVAKSDNGTGTGAPTDSQIFTSSYIVNVSGSQTAGTYVTTLTYICTATF
jgi:hypothetical protein